MLRHRVRREISIHARVSAVPTRTPRVCTAGAIPLRNSGFDTADALHHLARRRRRADVVDHHVAATAQTAIIRTRDRRRDGRLRPACRVPKLLLPSEVVGKQVAATAIEGGVIDGRFDLFQAQSQELEIDDA